MGDHANPSPPRFSLDGAPAKSASAPEPPPQVEGYEIRSPLGRGGMGTVWRAVQRSTQREVALKLLRIDATTSERAQARFEREVEIAATLSHPNIARVYDSGLNHGVYYYVLELIEGLPLDQHLAAHRIDIATHCDCLPRCAEVSRPPTSAA